MKFHGHGWMSPRGNVYPTQARSAIKDFFLKEPTAEECFPELMLGFRLVEAEYRRLDTLFKEEDVWPEHQWSQLFDAEGHLYSEILKAMIEQGWVKFFLYPSTRELVAQGTKETLLKLTHHLDALWQEWKKGDGERYTLITQEWVSDDEP